LGIAEKRGMVAFRMEAADGQLPDYPLRRKRPGAIVVRLPAAPGLDVLVAAASLHDIGYEDATA
jgi:hypothetical protein